MAEIRQSQTAVFDRRLTIGPADQDSDDFISTLSMGDWSGGGQIEELSGADQSRYWWGIFDGRSPHQGALPPYVFTPDSGKPTGATGASYPLGVVNDTAYFAFGTDICGFNEASSVWYTKESLGHAPIAKGVSFNGALYVACGSNGYKIITESAPGNPTVTSVTGAADPTTYDPNALYHGNPSPRRFLCAEGDKIFALTISGGIAWSNTGASGSWEWDWRDETGVYPKLHSSLIPYDMANYFNRNGVETIFVSHSGGVHNYDRGNQMFNQTSIDFPPHPDVGRSMAVWRPGEDLWVSMGLDVVHYTAANTTIPLSGVNRDSGLPPEYRGAILDLQPEISCLYAIVGGVNELYRYLAYSAKISATGTGNGQFDMASSVAVSPAGDVWVADLGNNRIQKLTSGLTYSAKIGSAGTGDGQFADDVGAFDVAVDGANSVWATDSGNHRIHKFSSTPTWTLAIDGRTSTSTQGTFSAKVGSNGSGALQFNQPMQLAVDSTGTVHIADFQNGRIQRYDANLNAIGTLYSITSVYGIGFDQYDNLYISNGSTIQRYEAGGMGFLDWTIHGSFRQIAVSADMSFVFAPELVSGKLRRYEAFTGAFSRETAAISGDIVGCAIGDNVVYVSDAQNDKVLVYNYTLTTKLYEFGGAGAGDGQFHTPNGIAVHPITGNVFVADALNDRIQEFTPLGVFVSKFGSDGSGNGQFSTPRGLAFSPDGTKLYVSDTGNSRIQMFVESTTISFGSGDTNFHNPKYIDICRSENLLFVSDTGNSRVSVWDIASTPTFAYTFGGSVGSGDGQFGLLGPGRLAVSADCSYVYVCDPSNDRVQQFTGAGEFVRVLGASGTGNGQFQNPSGVAISPTTNNVLIGDSTRNIVQEFTASGTYLRSIGGSGSGDGSFTALHGMSFNAGGDKFYTADSSLNRITLFLDSVTSDTETSTPHLQGWSGIGWQGLWEGTPGSTPTWMSLISVTGAYYLCWGMDDGLIRRMKLRRNVHNPRQLMQPFALDAFAPTGYIHTANSDMNMLGFTKIASHVIVFMRHATASEYLKVFYEVDDGGWVELGDVTTPGKTAFALGVAEIAPGEFASRGIAFNWIRFKLELYRGADITQSPIIRSFNLHFLKVPQNSSTFQFTVPLPRRRWNGRSPQEMSDTLNDLITSREMIFLRHQNRLYRGRLAQISGVDSTGQDFSGVRNINFVEINDEGGS